MQSAWHRSKRSLAVTALLLGAALSFESDSRELVPFPSTQVPNASPVQQWSPPVQDYRLPELERSLSGMDCNQLKALRAQLAEHQRAATIRADKEYFGQQIRIVDQRRKARNCLPR